MTKAQAIAEAARRWGKSAVIRREKCGLYKPDKLGRQMCSGVGGHAQPCPGGVIKYDVGYIAFGMFYSIQGTGKSWEEAFEKAEKSSVPRLNTR